jgi:dethiobiotin synthetase
MPAPQRLYVAANSQHVGKTTATLGLIATLRHHGFQTGYCKPVGQQYVDYQGTRIDKDAHLFASFLQFDLSGEWHSPVILGPGAVAQHLDQPCSEAWRSRILAADQALQAQHDLVVYEGTGHPGVGSTVDLSNADVANMLGAGVILVIEAGVGKTLDQLALSLSFFREREVPVLGVVVNKARRDKLAKVQYYVGKRLCQLGIPLLGVIPYEPELAFPQIQVLHRALNSECWLHADQLQRPIRGILGSSSLAQARLDQPEHWLLLVSDRRIARTLARLREAMARQHITHSPLAGIVVTGEEPCLTREDLEFLQQHRIPVLISALDTYEVVLTYGNLEVKMNARTPWKMLRAVELFQQHVDLSPLLGAEVRP